MTPPLILIGADGFLGQAIERQAMCRGVPMVVLTRRPLVESLRNRRRCDILDSSTTFESILDELGPRAIIHAAGSERSGVANILPMARRIAEAARSREIRVLDLSSDQVFDGRAGPYSEDSEPRPITPYGAAKLEAERLLIQSGALVLRTSLIFALDRMDHGTQWIQASLAKGERVTLFHDQRRSPVLDRELAQAILSLAAGSRRGLLHLGGAEDISRRDYAIALLDWWRVANRESVREGPCDPERWPRDTRLNSNCARSLGVKLSGFRELLQAARGSPGSPPAPS